MTIKMPAKLEEDVKTQAKARGVSASEYVCDLVRQHLKPIASHPVKSAYGRHSEYGPTHPEHEIYPRQKS